ncbi:DUF3450 domain-containing protein [Oceanococcus atlanticus]|nr:DUF3450 domain-containing protein [Oceanococcus atlanticus]RZO83423.1 MAG: DUF3450 domain-containing protein [Oceanococcus sp.]
MRSPLLPIAMNTFEDGLMAKRFSRHQKSSLLLAIGLCASTSVMAAAPLDKVVDEGMTKADSARESQARIDAMVDSQQAKLITYRALLKQIEGLEHYNQQLETQIKGQEALIERFDGSIAQVAKIERQMLPLVTRMAESLEAYVNLDLPFHEVERRERLAFIDETISKADINVAEKFRQVLEAYQVENEYGRKIDAYQDIIDIDGQPQEVDVLRFGRIAMVAQTKDTTTTAAWNHQAQRWDVIDAGTYRNSVRNGIRMARKQASIDMVTLPISAPEVAQ